jgi:hypothetical protein
VGIPSTQMGLRRKLKALHKIEQYAKRPAAGGEDEEESGEDEDEEEEGSEEEEDSDAS